MLSVLVIDDDAINRRLISKVLRDAGYRPIAVDGGQAALEFLANEGSVDLVICDLFMPVMTGVEVVRALRARPQWYAMPVLILTGKGVEADHHEAMEAGADDYMTKPFSSIDLLDAIGRMLDQPHTGTDGPI